MSSKFFFLFLSTNQQNCKTILKFFYSFPQRCKVCFVTTTKILSLNIFWYLFGVSLVAVLPFCISIMRMKRVVLHRVFNPSSEICKKRQKLIRPVDYYNCIASWGTLNRKRNFIGPLNAPLKYTSAQTDRRLFSFLEISDLPHPPTFNFYFSLRYPLRSYLILFLRTDRETEIFDISLVKHNFLR